jgi:hypothetical protein
VWEVGREGGRSFSIRDIFIFIVFVVIIIYKSKILEHCTDIVKTLYTGSSIVVVMQ